MSHNGSQDYVEDADWFWHVIARADRSKERLRDIFQGLTKEEVYKFQDLFLEMAVELQDEPYSHYVGPDESEDGLADISHWLVSQGRSRYTAVLEKPDLMPSHVEVGDTANLFPVAYEVYYDRFGESLDVM